MLRYLSGRRGNRCVGLLGVVEVQVHHAESVQHLVQVRWRENKRVPELEGPAPCQCRLSDRRWRSLTKHLPFLCFPAELAQGSAVDQVEENPLVGVEMEEDQG